MLGRFLIQFIDATIRYRKLVSLALQVAIICAAAALAHLLRFEMEFFARWDDFIKFLPIALLVKLPLNRLFHLNHGWWKYTSVGDVKRIIAGMAFAAVLIFLIQSLSFEFFSRAVIVLDFVITVGLKCGIRLGVRVLRERTSLRDNFRRQSDKRVLVVGAGDAGISLVKALQASAKLEIHVVGFLDDDRTKTRARFVEVPVLGDIGSLVGLAKEHAINEVYIAIPSLQKEQLDRIVKLCIASGVSFKTIPSLKEMIEQGHQIHQLREVEVEDLLGREPIRLNKSRTAQEIVGRTVMVTGAGGSIGSELCRQVLTFNPAQLILFERSEENLFYIERELREKFPQSKIVAMIGDILDETALDYAFKSYAPKLLYHAAAYKHVGMMQVNSRQAVKNNVLGTKILLDKAIASGCVEKFVNISTDKAVNPKSVMGYSKRLAEMVCQAKADEGVEVISVRFGNVLGSSGSAVQIFREQIRRGAPLTVTDKEATRFFMTAPEAVELVLHASTHGSTGNIYMLDMGQPVKVDQLARRMIELADPRGARGLSIVYTGLKEGEKLAEELAWESDDVLRTGVEKVFVLKPDLRGEVSQAALTNLVDCVDREPKNAAEYLKVLVDGIDRDLKTQLAARRHKIPASPSTQSEAFQVAG